MLQSKKDSLTESALRKALAGRVTKGSGDCPGENIVTMYLEGRLDPARRAHYEGHVADCAQCRQVLALAMKLAAVGDNKRDAAVSAGSARLSFRYGFAPSAIALLILGIGLLVFYEVKGPRKDAETADNKLSVSREARPTVEQPARSDDLNPVASGFNQEAPEKPKLSFAESKNAVPATKGLGGSGKAGKTRDEPVSETAPSQTALSAASPEAAVPPAEGQPRESPKDMRAGLTANMRRPDNAALEAGVGGGTEIQSKNRLESPQTVLVAFSERFLSDQGYASTVRFQDPSRSAPDVKTAKTDNARAERMAAKTQQPESELRLKVAAVGQEDPGRWVLRRIGDRVFYLASGYWIDAECGKHPHEKVVEISEGDGIWEQIRGAFPGLAELRSTKTPVLIHWNDKNYLMQ